MTGRQRIKAAFYRGGTSKAVVFNARDLPDDRRERDRMFLKVLGSPDRYKRQLNGMGGGLSSLSKVVIVEPSSRANADVDYTFVQVAVDEPLADYGSACGNMASAVGPFAVEEGLVDVSPDADRATVRIFNTNTQQIYRSSFPISGGEPVESGDYEIPGVTGGGAKIELEFLEPGGGITGALLPTGNARDELTVPEMGTIEVSLVDSANPVVFVRAGDVGSTGTEAPADLDADGPIMRKMDLIRRAGAVAMGMCQRPSEAAKSNPKVAFAETPANFVALDGSKIERDDFDIAVRLVSMGNFHRAITLTGALCVATAAKIPGTLLYDICGPTPDVLRVGNPSGVIQVTADVDLSNQPFVRSAGTFRTQRRLMEGSVLI